MVLLELVQNLEQHENLANWPWNHATYCTIQTSTMLHTVPFKHLPCYQLYHSNIYHATNCTIQTSTMLPTVSFKHLPCYPLYHSKSTMRRTVTFKHQPNLCSVMLLGNIKVSEITINFVVHTFPICWNDEACDW